MVEHTRDLKKIDHANVIQEAMKCVNKVSMFGRFKEEVRERLVSYYVFIISLNHNIRVCIFVKVFLLTSYMRA